MLEAWTSESHKTLILCVVRRENRDRCLNPEIGGASSNAPLKLRCLHYSWISDSEVHLKLRKIAGAIFEFCFRSRAILIWKSSKSYSTHLMFFLTQDVAYFLICNFQMLLLICNIRVVHCATLQDFSLCYFCLQWFTSLTVLLCLLACFAFFVSLACYILIKFSSFVFITIIPISEY